MCRRVECPKCKRPTFAGCGAHVEQVLGDVPRADRCNCREAKATDNKAAAGGAKSSWLSGLFPK